ncbi:MAG: hypothetical protein BROFUL_01938, partial [Candidatus Brocadia fulgida]
MLYLHIRQHGLRGILIITYILILQSKGTHIVTIQRNIAPYRYELAKSGN